MTDSQPQSELATALESVTAMRSQIEEAIHAAHDGPVVLLDLGTIDDALTRVRALCRCDAA